MVGLRDEAHDFDMRLRNISRPANNGCDGTLRDGTVLGSSVTLRVSCMRSPPTTPDVTPADAETGETVYILLDDFGPLGRAYRETDEAKADLETVIQDLLAGQFNKPVRIIAFNTAEGWARDVSEDIAWEIVERLEKRPDRLPAGTHDFISYHIGENVALRAESSLL